MEVIRLEILEKLNQAALSAPPSKFKDLKKYIGTETNFIGLSVPVQHALFKQGFSISHMVVDEQLVVWDKLWQTSGHYEVMNFAQMFVSRRLEVFEPAVIWETVKHWVKQVDNWAHSDGLSSIYVRLLEKEPGQVYAQYQTWNRSQSPWERRQSVVGLLYYSSARKGWLPFDQLLALVQPLIRDENYFVQKGVGWTLREMGNLYPAETLALLKAQAAAIPPAAFSAAIEKLDVWVKAELKQLRKASRRRLSIK